MNTDTIDFTKEVKIEETRRDNYNERPIDMSKILETDPSATKKVISEKEQASDVYIVNEEAKESQSAPPIDYDSLESEWFYLATHEYDHKGDMYNIDKDGNLIAKLEVGEWKDIIQKDGDKISFNQDKLKEAIRNSEEQIRFLEKQAEMKDEIKGYPELSEKTLQLFKPAEATWRFQKARNQLRAILGYTTDKNKSLLSLFSIIAQNRFEEYMEMINKKVITLCRDNTGQNLLFNYTYCYCINKGKFPSLIKLFRLLDLPYSKEFCEEYLYNEEEVTEIINNNYKEHSKRLIRNLADKINTNKISIEEVTRLSNQIVECSKPTLIEDKYDDLETYLEEKENEVTLSTGIKALDDRSFQLVKGKICSIFAYTGSFKTMFCTNVAYNAMNNGANVVYISLEIDKREMYFNFLSRHSYSDTFQTKISHSDIKAGRITEDEKNYLFNEISPHFKTDLKEHLIVYDETDISSNTYSVFTNLLSKAENQFMKATGRGVDLIIVDHINLLKFGGERKQNDYSAVNHWMAYFRKNSIDFLGKGKQVAILCAAQSSREGFKEATNKNHGKYSLTSIAEGNEIERSSAYVLSIYTSDEDRKNNKTQMQILKYRDDAHNDNLIPILVDPKYYAFGIDEQIETTISDKYSNINNNKPHLFNRTPVQVQQVKVTYKNND